MVNSPGSAAPIGEAPGMDGENREGACGGPLGASGDCSMRVNSPGSEAASSGDGPAGAIGELPAAAAHGDGTDDCGCDGACNMRVNSPGSEGGGGAGGP